MVSLRVRVSRYGKGQKPLPTPCHWWSVDELLPSRKRLFWCRRLHLRDVEMVLNGTDGWAVGDLVACADVHRKMISVDFRLPEVWEVDVDESFQVVVWDRVARCFRLGLDGPQVFRLREMVLTPEEVRGLV